METSELNPQQKAKRLQMLKDAYNRRIKSTKEMFAAIEDVNELPDTLVGG